MEESLHTRVQMAQIQSHRGFTDIIIMIQAWCTDEFEWPILVVGVHKYGGIFGTLAAKVFAYTIHLGMLIKQNIHTFKGV